MLAGVIAQDLELLIDANLRRERQLAGSQPPQDDPTASVGAAVGGAVAGLLYHKVDIHLRLADLVLYQTKSLRKFRALS